MFMDNKDESIEETYSDIVRDRTLGQPNIQARLIVEK